MMTPAMLDIVNSTVCLTLASRLCYTLLDFRDGRADRIGLWSARV